jgi:hypothetical protein
MRAEKRVRRTEKAIKAKRYTPKVAPGMQKQAAVKISTTPNPAAKPPSFKGKPTAGTPTRRELQRAARAGTLKVNKKGFATTPQVRKTAGTVKRLTAKARHSTAPLPGLTPQQSHVARRVLRTGDQEGATRKEKLAAAETGLVEAPNFENPAGGDADSEGWRQERTSIYGTGPQGPRNVRASAKRFFHEVRTDAGTSTAPTAGLLAQAAQGSAYPERYDERKPEAAAMLKAYEKGGLKPAQRKQLAKAKTKAQQLGLVVGSKGVGPAPKKVVTRFKAAKVAMREVEGQPYIWGGGHGSPTSSPTGGGLDCSGAVGYVLNKIHAMKGSLTSGAMGSVLRPGPGALTVFYNDDHTFLRRGNEYWGTSVGDDGSGGLGPHPAPSADYLAQYNVGHVPGLGRKQALQLGFKDLGAGSEAFPGMTLSPGGTTATIDPGAGSTQSKPGFSKSPIRLTQTQKARRTLRKLKQVGVGSTADAEVSPMLKALEEKYGAKAA